MTIKSINPATLELVGEVEENTISEVRQTFIRARKVQKKWRKLPVEERAKRVAGVTKYIAEHFDDISELISKEVGKPPAEAFVAEVYGAIDSTFHYYNKAAEVLGQKEEIPLGMYESLNKQSYVVFKPVGVVAVIGPYNYPFIIPFEQITQSLMAGNAVIFKPSSDTILVGKKIQEFFDSTDLPIGLVQTVFGPGSTIGNLLVDEADTVIFTGSTETGKRIMKRAAETLTPVVLELGGKDAMVVFPDADIDRAVHAARWGVFTNSGQVCASVKRLYVHQDIKEEFTTRLVELTRQLRQGNPLETGIDVGAMVNEEQLKIVEEKVEKARQSGARILCGGRRNPDLEGYFYEPTVIDSVPNNAEIVQQEVFGPVLVVIPFKTEEEVIEMVNDNPYGLTSSVWTQDIERAERVALDLDTGTVMINEVVYTFALAATPWGGPKQSGLGRTHGHYGFQSVVRPLHVNIDQSKDLDPWWFEQLGEMVEGFREIARALVVK